MEETHATQYIFSPDSQIYHIARSELLSLCGLWLNINPEHRKRRDDRRLSSEKPIGQFTALCSECDRKANGLPEPQRPSLDLLPRFSRFEIVP
ncbi:MAG: hypothetical protein QOH70_2839 [Blastocatellia bacterium]|jgi:hypothetical protein|nr:hypothetical protein [Blastocatellia bacterium]